MATLRRAGADLRCPRPRRIDGALPTDGFATPTKEAGTGSPLGTRVDPPGVVPDTGPRTSSAYLFVDDADQLAEEWRAGGVDVHPPEDTEWRMREGAVVDPDGNVIRFGSPI